MNLEAHPTVQRVRLKMVGSDSSSSEVLDSDWLKQLVRDAGADDVGLVEIRRPALDDQRADILKAFPHAQTLISFVVRMNQEPIRSPARSVANLEFHSTGDQVNDIARTVVRILQEQGNRALNPSMGFPMEMDRFPDEKIWVVSHKPVAVAAGLGMMGIHRNVIHPKFGNFILLGTILLDSQVTRYDHPIDYNPCLECKLCVAACPVGAIAPNGDFNFAACYTHNYKEFMGGFNHWAEQLAESKHASDYRNRVTDSESASMWQSLAFGPNYKAAYCLSVCPAGEDVIGPYLANKTSHLKDNLRPLQEKRETIYVLKNSDAEEHVARRFPHKKIKRVDNNLRSRSLDGFLRGVRLTFQPGKSKELDATFHFTFTGKESRMVTIVIRDQSIHVHPGHIDTASLHIQADTETWLAFIRKEASLIWALLRRKIRLRGQIRLLLAFGNCFPR